MRVTPALVTLCLLASSTLASAQDERLPVIRPQLEIVKASPTPFPFADKTAADYDTWIRTHWIQMNRAKCGDDCLQIAIHTTTGLVQIDTAARKKGRRETASRDAGSADVRRGGLVRRNARFGRERRRDQGSRGEPRSASPGSMYSGSTSGAGRVDGVRQREYRDPASGAAERALQVEALTDAGRAGGALDRRDDEGRIVHM